ncbi:hypothetical protein MN608_05528 [Microdochium nivale]|nr:hypothetical protein MN608_05528 [Microdochium nivale]
MASHVALEWEQAWDPFDAVGIPPRFINLEPPTQEEFDKFVGCALHMTEPERVRSLDHADKCLLPYNQAQIHQSVQYFTNNTSKIDGDAWRCAYNNIIVHGNYSYARKWKPESRDWLKCLLKKPTIVDLSTVSTIGFSPARPNMVRHHVSAQYNEPVPFSVAGSHKNASKPLAMPKRVKQEDTKMLDSITDLPKNHTTSNIPRPSGAYSLTFQSPTPFSTTVLTSTSTTTTRPRKPRVFLGFHRNQLGHAEHHTTPGDDYRQPIYGSLDQRGRVQRRLCKENLAGKTIPWKHTLPGKAPEHDDILYCGGFVGLDQQQVRSRIRQVLRSSATALRAPEWVPTPAEASVHYLFGTR